MAHYKSNLRDIEFNLFEVFGRDEVLGQGPYEAVDADTAREMLKEYARLAENELAESFADADRNPPVFDPETSSVAMPESFKKSYKAFQDAGFWSLDLPEELDGTVAPPSLRWAMNELVLGANPAIGMFGASYSFAKLLFLLGNDEQKKLAKWIAEKGWHCTMVLTEPDAGSDPAGMKTRAEKKGDRYVLNGTKFWITNAPHAETLVVYARTGDGNGGVTAFLIEKGMKGFSVSRKLDKMGMRGSDTAELVFEDCEVPEENIMGGEGRGAAVLMSGLDYERAVLSGGPVGIMQAALDVVLPYIHDRKQFGQSIGEFQLIQGKVADMYTTLQAARSYLYTVGKNLDALGTDHVRQVRKDCAAVILYTAEKATWMAGESVQILGGNGYINEYPVGRLWRDAKLYEIGAGTSEIRRMLIGRELFAETM